MRTLLAPVSALALALSGSTACTDPAEPPPGPAPLELEMNATIPPGAEVELCQFVTVPETWVTNDNVTFTTGSHHVLVVQTPYTEIPTQRRDGTPIDTSGVFDCSEGAMNSWQATKIIGGSQNLRGESFLSFPEGVGVRIGGILLLNAHYRNGSDAPLDATAKVSFDTATPEMIEQEGDVMFLYNPLISVPAGSTASARWRCPVYQDITIVNAQSHMHSRGVGFEARVDERAPFYVNNRWEDVPVKSYEDLTAKAGSVLDYRCDYRNTSGTPIYQGHRTTDEMCVLTAAYYPADPRISFCLDEAGKLPGGEWIGQGTATCLETMRCLQEASSFAAQTNCMMAASPTVSRESSELLRCFMGATDPVSQCVPQMQACAAR
jgi:Copper type II ascorbate-dependent monooxygenase, C-terminal domain